MRILLVLLEKGRIKSLTDLAQALGVKSIVAPSKRVWDLEKLGLIKVKMAEKPPLTMEIELTPLGREAAKLVKRLDELLTRARGQGGEAP